MLKLVKKVIIYCSIKIQGHSLNLDFIILIKYLMSFYL